MKKLLLMLLVIININSFGQWDALNLGKQLDFRVIKGINTSNRNFRINANLTNNGELSFSRSTTDSTLPSIIDATFKNGMFGIGITPVEVLHVQGNVRFSGAILPNGDAGLTGQYLTSNAGGANTWATPFSASSTTSSYLPKMVTLNSMTNSQIYDNGSSIGINTTSPVSKFHIVRTGSLYGSEGTAALSITSTDPLKRLTFGYDNAIDASYIQSVYSGNGIKPLILNPTGGAIGINNVSPSASSILDIAATTKGVLIPRMTSAQWSVIASKATGLMAYILDAREGVRQYKSTGSVRFLDTDDSLLFRQISDTATSSSSTATRGRLQNGLDSLSATLIKTGIVFFSGDGSTTTFDITLPTTPSWANAEASSATGANITYRTPITNGIRIFYAVAPPVGTNNISISYQYK